MSNEHRPSPHQEQATDPQAIRHMLERIETETLASGATLSQNARRRHAEDPSPIRTEFQRDRDRIIHSKSFRRLKHKTQLFISPHGDHYRTRLTHTLEVTQIARTIGRALRLNEDLIEAIGLGHDLGHTPFGHAGERALANVWPGFRHNEQSLRVVDVLEKDGRGLNLTEPVRNGILRHSKPRSSITGDVSGTPTTLEGAIVKISDGVAYMNHDLDDSLRSGMISIEDVPANVLDILGQTHAERINTLVLDIIASSSTEPGKHGIALSPEVRNVADSLRHFLFERVYDPINQRAETLHAQRVVRSLYEYFVDHPKRMPIEQVVPTTSDDTVERRAVDVVASMTDRYAVEVYDSLFATRVLAP